MDAAGFPARVPVSTHSACRPIEWLAATAKLVCGAALLFAVARLIPKEHEYLIGWTGMIAIVLILHFGLFQLLSCYWRSLGIEARPIMNRPLASTSLSEFWGRRWNAAFRDLAHRFLFRPLHLVVRAAHRLICGIPVQWRGTRFGHLGTGKRRIRKDRRPSLRFKERR